MPMTCREHSAEKLADILKKTGPTSIGKAAALLHRGVRYTRSIVEQFPDRFDMVGITGGVATWCISITNKERPIQLTLTKLPEQSGPNVSRESVEQALSVVSEMAQWCRDMKAKRLKQGKRVASEYWRGGHIAYDRVEELLRLMLAQPAATKES